MTDQPATHYSPAEVEAAATRKWLERKAFAATPDERDERYVVMMPLPNVTGALHMGHAIDNVMQDLLTRWHRMQGDNTLWMPGTDHAGIATQAVVERRLFELEGRSRHDIGREGLVERIWEWKHRYGARIVEQQQAMGCGCDWDRQRFTMDAVCARAVRKTFFSMFRDGLIYQGDRLVNWDCHLQTAVSDDELYRETVHGSFWYLRYPVIDPEAGEPDHVIVATTRPETMLGDTAVACHPDPRGALETALAAARDKAGAAGPKDRAAADAEVERLEARLEELIPHLEQVAAMARAGRRVRLPLQDRPIPIILDEWAKPELGTGCVKITPAHDPNDYEVWTRHKDRIAVVNILCPDGTLSPEAGAYQGLERMEARKRVVADIEALGLLDKVEDREMEVDHSDRSKTVIEPWLSKQWFVRMSDVEGGIVMGRGTAHEFRSPGLAQAALDAVDGEWRSATGRRVSFHPDPDRYRRIYEAWVGEKRDWCISRQLWWGHRIPVWSGPMQREQLLQLEGALTGELQREDVAAFVVLPDGTRLAPKEAFDRLRADPSIDRCTVQVCFLEEQRDEQMGTILEMGGLELDPDVLDTWFSSALWPHSTLGWPDPATAPQEAGQSPMVHEGRPDTLSYYYPGSCLVTGRDIITLWVARMVIAGLYNLGDVPFTDVFLHATILDGRGVRMSKSKGNGVDPLDICEMYGADAMRYVLCEMQTGTQDVRLPVQAISPATGKLIDLATAEPGPDQGTYIDPATGELFDLVGHMEKQGVPQAKATSDRFEIGSRFCNKLWNAVRFALLNLEDAGFAPLERSALPLEDRWILSRLAATVDGVQQGLEAYNPSVAVGRAREFFWGEVCDWYLELLKPRLKDPAQAPAARQVLATVLDQTLRLLHPFVPFITEELWERLGELAPQRGIESVLPGADGLLCHAPWPTARAGDRSTDLEGLIGTCQEMITALREIRARYNRTQREPLAARVRATGATAAALQRGASLVRQMANLSTLDVDGAAERTVDSATAVVGDAEAYVLGVVDPAQERARLVKQKDKLVKQRDGLARKLDNPGFLGKAPQAVVEKEKAALAELSQQIQGIDDALAALG